MPLAKLQGKGQITLPSAIRTQLHAEKGDVFDFQMQADQTVILKKKPAAKQENKAAQSSPKKDLSPWLDSKPGLFSSADEVDAFIRQQRDIWS